MRVCCGLEVADGPAREASSWQNLLLLLLRRRLLMPQPLLLLLLTWLGLGICPCACPYPYPYPCVGIWEIWIATWISAACGLCWRAFRGAGCLLGAGVNHLLLLLLLLRVLLQVRVQALHVGGRSLLMHLPVARGRQELLVIGGKVVAVMRLWRGRYSCAAQALAGWCRVVWSAV